MKALEALHNRSSAPRLCDPIPAPEVLENIYKAAFRAADHALLRPWRFLLIKGGSRERLGELFASAALEDDANISAEQQQRLRQKALRAPLILVTVASTKPHPKVPVFEQDLSAAAATQNMLNAAFAQGVGAMWRTGAMAYHPAVMRGLGLAEHEKIIGFLYLGTRSGAVRNLPQPRLSDYFQDW
jgi:nitroreductase